MFELYEPLLVGARQLWSIVLPRWWLGTLALGVCLTGWNIWQGQILAAPVQAEPQNSATLTIVEPNDQIVVDVAGAVVHPGMYQLDSGARIGQAITRAGGYRTGVDDRSVAQKINLAQKLQDEDKIYIPFESDASIVAAKAQLAVPESKSISLNSASQTELESLTGIGEIRAQEIIAGRPYSNLNDLVERNIVSSTIFEQLKAHISL